MNDLKTSSKTLALSSFIALLSLFLFACTDVSDVTDPDSREDIASWYKGAGSSSNLSNAISSSSLAPISYGELIDTRDDHVYKTVKIGSQVWMAENLAYLPYVNGKKEFSYTEAKYYVYDYDGTSVSAAKENTNYTTYGVLYNWTAAMDSAAASNKVPSGVKGACPIGWHIPSSDEWDILRTYEGGSTSAGIRLKAKSSLWFKDPGLDFFGFSGLPGGSNHDEVFSHVGLSGYWWSTSGWLDDYLRIGLDMQDGYDYFRSETHYGCVGLSVRCIQD